MADARGMMGRLIHIIGVAGLTAGVGGAAWFLLRTAAPVQRPAPVNRTAANADESLPAWPESEPRPGDLVDASGEFVARNIEDEEDREGVRHVGIFEIRGQRLIPLRLVEYSVPIAWSPVEPGLLLLREASGSCGQQNYLFSMTEPAAPPRYVGCWYCNVRSWDAASDTLIVECMHGHTAIENVCKTMTISLSRTSPP